MFPAPLFASQSAAGLCQLQLMQLKTTSHSKAVKQGKIMEFTKERHSVSCQGMPSSGMNN